MSSKTLLPAEDNLSTKLLFYRIKSNCISIAINPLKFAEKQDENKRIEGLNIEFEFPTCVPLSIRRSEGGIDDNVSFLIVKRQ